MKKIYAKFKSKCAETGEVIAKGQEMIYDYKAKKCYSLNSQTAFKYGQALDLSYSNDDASLVAAQEDAYWNNFLNR
jgi:hypothetical protein